MQANPPYGATVRCLERDDKGCEEIQALAVISIGDKSKVLARVVSKRNPRLAALEDDRAKLMKVDAATDMNGCEQPASQKGEAKQCDDNTRDDVSIADQGCAEQLEKDACA
jgi:hypothetical protein